MNIPSLLLAATALAFTASASADCYFDVSPDDGDDLVANTKFSLGGDACNAFEIRVGKVGVSLSDEEPVLIPRSAVYSWQGCRFTNVLNQNDIDLYVTDAVDDQGEVLIYGYCGYVDQDGPMPDADAPFVPVGDPVGLLLRLDVDVD
jgi:hypothetical protein